MGSLIGNFSFEDFGVLAAAGIALAGVMTGAEGDVAVKSGKGVSPAAGRLGRFIFRLEGGFR